MILILGGMFLWTAPKRAENALKNASLADLQSITQREPDNPRAWYYLGLRSQESGKLADSAQAYARASQLDPDDAASCIGSAKMSLATQGAQASFGILNTFLKTHAKSAPVHAALAQLYQRTGYPKQANEEAATATDLDPSNADGWQIIGTVAMGDHNYFAAEQALQKAVTGAPKDWHNRVALGNALLRLTRTADAVASYREAVRLAPNEALPHLELGKALLSSAATPNDYEAARAALLQAIALQATLAQEGVAYADLYIGQSYEREARWPEALTWLSKAVSPTSATATGSNEVDVHFELARVYQALGDTAKAASETKLHQDIVGYDTARTDLINRLNAAPRDVGLRLKLARLYAAHGEDASSAKMFHSVLQLAPNLANVVQADLDAIRHHHSSM